MQSRFDVVTYFTHLILAYQPIFDQKKTTLIFKSSNKAYTIKANPHTIINNSNALLLHLLLKSTAKSQICLEFIAKPTDRQIFSILIQGIQTTQKKLDHFSKTLTEMTVERLEIDQFIAHFYSIRKKSKTTDHPVNHHGIPPYHAEIRQKLYSHFSSIDSFEQMASRKSLVHGRFLKKVNQIIEDHLDDENFKIEHLCKEVGVSRSQLYRRLTPLIKMSPAKYLQYYRLKKALAILQQTTYSIGQVITMVGFASQSHFTRAFSEQFGLNPSHYRKKNKV